MKSEENQIKKYSPAATKLICELESRVENIFEGVKRRPFWGVLTDQRTPTERIRGILREVFLSVYMYQRLTTEAGFHMLGRLPKADNCLMKSLMLHKLEEAEHGEWALRDYIDLGGSEKLALAASASPATFAVASVWWRMAVAEEPFGYLGAEFLFEYLTVKATEPLLAPLKSRGFGGKGVRFIVEHATEDIRHTNLIRHLAADVETRYPGSAAAILRCFAYFQQVYPLPVWDEAYDRACRS